MSKVTPNNRIINAVAKYVEVLAAPGSGKTYTLIQRIKWLVNNGVSTNEILVLSFSTSTVGEVEKRIKREANLITNKVGAAHLLDANTHLSNVSVQTAHAYANTIIKTKQKVLSDNQAAALVKEAIQLACKDCNKADVSPAVKLRRLAKLKHLSLPTQIKQLLQINSYAQASGKSVKAVISQRFTDMVGYDKVVVAVINRYSRLKQLHSVIDYGDMFTHAITALGNAANTAVAVPYTHILVDEYQDCSQAQTQFLTQLATHTGCNLMVFGDRNQAIYGFSGAGYTPLSDALDGVKELGLPESRRLTPQIAALASAVAGLTGDDVIQTLPGHVGDKPVLVIDKSLKRQTQHAVQHITQLIDSGVAANKIAVLARTKALLQPVEALLLANQVDTARNGVVRHSRHVNCVLWLLHILERSLEKSTKITPDMLQKVMKKVKVSGAILKRESMVLQRAAETKSIDGRYKLCAQIYLRLLGGLREDKKAARDDVNRYEAFSRGYADARAIRTAIRSFNPEAVITGTIHSAKGGEWDHVLIVGVTDGLLPIHFTRNDDEQALSEERNLLYVAITRARKSLRLFHAPANSPSNRDRYENVCRFIDTDAVSKTLHMPKSR